MTIRNLSRFQKTAHVRPEVHHRSRFHDQGHKLTACLAKAGVCSSLTMHF